MNNLLLTVFPFYYKQYLLSYKCLIIFSLLIYLVFLFSFSTDNKLIFKDESKKIIFTFWEPRKNIPGYLQLCIKTWKKFLPEYEIKILDYNSVRDSLGESLFGAIICQDMSLQMQSDAIRVAILKKYGGIWMDADTIIINRHFLNELEKYELVMIGEEKFKSQHIGFIFSSVHSSILNEWFNRIIDNINYFKQINNDTKKSWIFNQWDYLGNKIIDSLTKNFTGEKFFRLDKYKINAFPELNYFGNSSLNGNEKYRLFYFSKGDIKDINSVFENSKGIILLHNSWTPLDYKNMSEKEFLKQDILLSKLFSKILEINI